MSAAVFWAAVVFVGYTYVGYPLLIHLLARLRRAPAGVDGEGELPPVTVVIAAHNEAGRIEKKVANLRGLDYPQDRLRILIVSDGSTDGSDQVLAGLPTVEAIAYPERRGKPHALNEAMKRVATDIVVFCDIRQMIDTPALKILVRRLLQPGVGAVSGELVHIDPANQTAASIGLYWRYEKWIRKSESDFASTIGATGAFYAIYSKSFQPLPEDTLLDDFEIPMRIVRSGARNVFESRALFFDELQKDTAGERKRKIRTLTGNFQAFWRQPWLLSPLHNPVFIQFVSHKVLRLLVPYALAAALISSFLAPGPFYMLAAALQVLFYATALAGLSLAALRRNRLVSFAGVFVELNWAAVVALYQFLFSRIDARWQKT